MQLLPESLTNAIAKFEQNFRSIAQTHGERIVANSRDLNNSLDDDLKPLYYDSIDTFIDGVQYVGPASLEYAKAASDVYQDWVIDNQAQIPGFWMFSDGLTKLALMGDAQASDTVKLMASNGFWTRDAGSNTNPSNFEESREVAYAGMTLLNAEKLGAPRSNRVHLLADWSLGHLEQMVGSDRTAPYVQSFMVALTSEFLIRYYEATNDSRVIPALEKAINSLWDLNWVPSARAFKYSDQVIENDPSDVNPAPDLNLFFPKIFEWLYKKTGDITFRERGDEIFISGTEQSYLGNEGNGFKQFNQQYFTGFEYLELRNQDEALPLDLTIIGTLGNDQLLGGAGNDTLLGLRGVDQLVGNAGNDAIDGGRGGDLLQGGLGADRFVYQGPTALINSRIAAPDSIVDFNPAEGDRIQLDYDSKPATLDLPGGLFNAGIQRGQTLERATRGAFADKNQQSAGRQVLGVNEAVLFSYGNATYLAVNNGQPEFNARRDMVTNLTGTPYLPGSAAVLPVTDIFG